jgi:hypothetical protein
LDPKRPPAVAEVEAVEEADVAVVAVFPNIPPAEEVAVAGFAPPPNKLLAVLEGPGAALGVDDGA